MDVARVARVNKRIRAVFMIFLLVRLLKSMRSSTKGVRQAAPFIMQNRIDGGLFPVAGEEYFFKMRE
jgi:hypothetical protein